jgi:hypothetical protein
MQKRVDDFVFNYSIPFNALMDMSQNFTAEVPSYPTEQGFKISDSIICNPLEMDMTLFTSDMPITFTGSDVLTVDEVVSSLKSVYFSQEPVTLQTPEGIYENMAITSFTIIKTPDLGNAKEIPISFRQIKIVDTKTTYIPESYGRSGETTANTGNSQTTGTGTTYSNGTKTGSVDATPKINSQWDYEQWLKSKGETKSSIAYNLANAVGFL